MSEPTIRRDLPGGVDPQGRPVSAGRPPSSRIGVKDAAVVRLKIAASSVPV